MLCGGCLGTTTCLPNHTICYNQVSISPMYPRIWAYYAREDLLVQASDCSCTTFCDTKYEGETNKTLPPF